jgi:LacI family transcriptional regulator
LGEIQNIPNKSVYSVKEIADMAGVSVATVSRVINQNGRFSKETEERVRAIIKETNFQPNQLARGLRTNRVNTIGILVPDISNEFFSKIVLEIQKRLFERDYITLIFNTNEDAEVEQRQLSILQSQKIGGLIYISGNSHSKQNMGLPTIYIDRKPVFENDEHRYLMIESDNIQGGFLATEELIRKGCRNIACISFRERLSTHGGRIKGYQKALRQHNLPSVNQNILFVETVTSDAGHDATQKLLSENPSIDGVFYTADVLAMGALQAINEMNLSIPSCLKIVGFDDISQSTLSIPPLTTIRQNIETFGKLATDFIIDMIAGITIEERLHVIPVDLIVRKST